MPPRSPGAACAPHTRTKTPVFLASFSAMANKCTQDQKTVENPRQIRTYDRPSGRGGRGAHDRSHSFHPRVSVGEGGGCVSRLLRISARFCEMLGTSTVDSTTHTTKKTKPHKKQSRSGDSARVCMQAHTHTHTHTHAHTHTHTSLHLHSSPSLSLILHRFPAILALTWKFIHSKYTQKHL